MEQVTKGQEELGGKGEVCLTGRGKGGRTVSERLVGRR